MNDAREIVFVVARARNGCIGKDGAVPWTIREDLRHFVRQTMGKPMVMGRKTFDSLPSVLPGRRHIVLTRNRRWRATGAEVAHDPDGVFALVEPADDLAVIGGSDVFRLFEPYATRLEITEIDEDTPGCDVFMPDPDPDTWREVRRDPRPAADGHPAFAFVTYSRMPDRPAQVPA